MSVCPSCDSKNTKKLQMVWASGSRTGKNKSTGIGISSRGTIGVGIGSGSSTSQSHLAASCAPPKNSLTPKIVVGLIGVFIIPTLLSGVLSVFTEPRIADKFFNFIVSAPLFVLAIWGLFKLYKYLDQSNKKALNDYSNTWICLKCGTKYIHKN